MTGRIIVRGTTTPVSRATISLEGTTLATTSDDDGRYTLLRAPSGPQVLVARRLGYALSRVPVTVPASGVLTVEVRMATSELKLDNIIVTADRSSRAKGELGTASVIDRNAIANQIASSLQGVLELTPGVPLQPPGLDNKEWGAPVRSLDAPAVGS
ncbi:MAG: carboxypeptidase-like regulatory domain-containing protein [Gemmatimonadaceae bacterium]